MVRCEVTGRSRGSSRDHTSLAAVPLRTLSRVFGRVRKPCVDVFPSWRGRRGVEEGCGKRFPRFPRRDASPLAPRLSHSCCPLSGIQPLVRARARPTPNTQRTRTTGWREAIVA